MSRKLRAAIRAREALRWPVRVVEEPKPKKKAPKPAEDTPIAEGVVEAPEA